MWYSYYARERVDREGAIYHVFERLDRNRDAGLDRELRENHEGEGALRDADPFEEVVTAASIIDTPGGTGFRDVIWEASAHLADASGVPVKELGEDFLQGTVRGHDAGLSRGRASTSTSKPISNPLAWYWFAVPAE